MELKIAETIKKYRKARDMTQNEFARAPGVSPQSVSNWETSDGYPDITLLPGIANYFAITVDELIGNDEIGQKMDIDYFEETFYTIEDALERVRFAAEYARKYPQSNGIAVELMESITELDPEDREKYMSLMRDTAHRIINESTLQ